MKYLKSKTGVVYALANDKAEEKLKLFPEDWQQVKKVEFEKYAKIVKESASIQSKLEEAVELNTELTKQNNELLSVVAKLEDAVATLESQLNQQ